MKLDQIHTQTQTQAKKTIIIAIATVMIINEIKKFEECIDLFLNFWNGMENIWLILWYVSIFMVWMGDGLIWE